MQGYGTTKALSADGRTAIGMGTAGEDQVLMVWDVERGERRAILPQSGGSFYSMALTPDGQVAVLALNGPDERASRLISLWNLAEERRIVSIRPPPRWWASSRAWRSSRSRRTARCWPWTPRARRRWWRSGRWARGPEDQVLWCRGTARG
ncbi:MAG: hypothetical protein R3F43_13680 [bacterium]